MHSILDPDELYEVLVAIVAEKLESGPMALFIYDRSRNACDLVRTHGLPELEGAEPTIRFEEGLLWQNVLQYEPFPVTSASGEVLFERFFEQQKLDGLRSDLWVPLFLKDALIGLITLGNREDGPPYDEHEMEFLKQFAPTAASSLNMCHLYVQRNREKEDLSRTFRNLTLLYDIGRAMTLISDLKQLLGYILEQATTVTGAKKGSIMLHDQEKNILELRVIEGLDNKDLQDKINNYEIHCRTFSPGEGVAGKVYQTGQPLLINDTNDEQEFVEVESSFVDSIACVPMKVYGDVIGVINVTNKNEAADFTGEDIELLEAIADQTAVAINKAQLWELSVRDSLTELYLRRFALAKFNSEIIRSRRFGHGLAIGMCDIDSFKAINDSQGHDTGDEVLRRVAKLFQEEARTIDCVARYGGEEFLLLFVETDKAAAVQAAERIQQRIEQLEMPRELRVTVSIGVAAFPEDGSDVEDLIKKADEALYIAKENGKNQVVAYSA